MSRSTLGYLSSLTGHPPPHLGTYEHPHVPCPLPPYHPMGPPALVQARRRPDRQAQRRYRLQNPRPDRGLALKEPPARTAPSLAGTTTSRVYATVETSLNPRAHLSDNQPGGVEGQPRAPRGTRPCGPVPERRLRAGPSAGAAEAKPSELSSCSRESWPLEGRPQ